ncbi:methyl-accepting chemotaxis protein [Azohydromonas aeria]|uniref:methyl-accepting chemotaxis protein n=1 Tax=Azohydromonas aeria TaxID=2590212 RepID=UPI001E50C980|nr:methyl-accepting chemotaxis protein [Azohydromonas aeria]
MSFAHLKTRTMLPLGFATVLLFMLALTALGMAALNDIERLHSQALARARVAVALPDTATVEIKREVASTNRLMMALAGAGMLVGLGCAVGLARAIEQPLNQAVYIAETVAAGDLSQEFKTELGGDFGRLLGALGNMEDTLTDLVTRIKGSTDAIASASKQIDGGNTDLARRTEQQAASLQQTAASMDQLTQTVQLNAERARSGSGLAAHASQVAEQGGAVMEQVVQSMNSIHSSSRKVSDITDVIEGIAFQTNILALNAAVEAARAGEQGRGFAVVATEVRQLAQRSSQAAKEIKTLIDDAVGHVDSGSALVRQAGGTMGDIVQAVLRVNAILGEISVALADQSSGIAQVNQAVSHMDQVTQQNAALVQQATAVTSALAEQAHVLQGVVDEFKI